MSSIKKCRRCRKYKAKTNGLCGYCLRSGKKGQKRKLTGESYYHRAAKAILATYFLRQGYDVAYEFPIVNIKKHDAAAKPWCFYKDYPHSTIDTEAMAPFATNDKLHPQPSREWLIEQGMSPYIIYDLVVFKKKKLMAGYEVRYRHKCDAKKQAIIKKIQQQSSVKYKVYEISARWLLGQIAVPKKLKTIRELGN